MTASNRIEKVAIVGASGHSGSFMTNALLETGRHQVTALTRVDSESKFPDGVVIKKIDYSRPETLVDALRGQDALVITLSGHTPKGTELQLVNAAGEAGVPWILPNEWSPDTANEALVKDVFVFEFKVATRKAITELGKSSFISVSTGFWYEWSLAIKPAYGFDFDSRTVTFFDDGETKICTTTWPHLGRAVAALLSLPIQAEGGDDKACLDALRNQVVYVNSFNVSQRDMLESALRVTGTRESDWTITRVSAEQRYADGVREIKEGVRVGFAKMMYTRVFFADGCGDFETKGTINGVLGLPKEDMDTATRAAIERSKGPVWV
ncbi:hypothetical protein PFICI_05000 [Pestalotiopsis fici W106-1]|uniref:NmrA-like domain-containing protein n=1 Tax=Pestalotiopsis fici (strain W106-1 / CGMCC3.15140) TaxID=1229662 RepID=W3XAQ7_PESFW|nr:uncharacterized protein PFICI_05000 [Pestalotiopsis fici W106-1]ETS83124.1 hypothetical protein PFICI_05000 [Pestalotiopsis fici W106-1]